MASASASAQIKVKIGGLTNISGALSDSGGEGSITAAHLAIEDFRPQDHGLAVELVYADHQNKPDVALSIVREWIDNQGVDAIADVPASSVALAVSVLVRTKNKVLLVSGSGTSELTGRACSPNTIQWTYDTWADANGVVGDLVGEGYKSWFFVTADYAFGQALQADAADALKASGGQVLGNIRTPFPTDDFSSYLLQAAGSKAQVIALATGGADTVNAVKQAAEFGVIGSGRKLVALLMGVTDIHAIGLGAAQGLTFTTASYWDLNDGTRAFARRFAAARGGAEPGDLQMVSTPPSGII